LMSVWRPSTSTSTRSWRQMMSRRTGWSRPRRPARASPPCVCPALPLWVETLKWARPVRGVRQNSVPSRSPSVVRRRTP
jgi:hypothetical protein